MTKGSFNTKFDYSPSRSRYKREDWDGSTLKETKVTASGLETVFKTVNGNATTEVRRYVGNALMKYTYTGSSSVPTKSTEYIFKDHLGSTDTILTLNGSLDTVTKVSFGSFGERRAGFSNTGLTSNQTGVILNITDKGYTGHEQMDDVGLIHMNGRVYDPKLGRFMSADPFVQAPTDTQSLNRYSYVLNNPMSATDPSGYFFKKYWRAIAAIVTSFYMGPWAAGYFNSAILGGAATGFVAGGIGSGTLKGAFTGALGGALLGAVSTYADHMSYSNFKEIAVDGNKGLLDKLQNFGGNFLTSGQIAGISGLHAIAGGVMSSLQGGKFGHGFFSAGFTKATMGSVVSSKITIGNAFKSSLVAGTASSLTGGKFTNGAITGAFQYSLNWSTKAHNYFIKKSYGDELSDIQIAAMEAGSRYADSISSGFQEDDKSFMHSQTSSKWTDKKAMEMERDKFVALNVKKGAGIIGSSPINDVKGAFYIGHGLHAVMDQYSPAHTGANQFWKKSDFYKHGPMPTSLEGVNTAMEQQYNNVSTKMREIWSPNQ